MMTLFPSALIRICVSFIGEVIPHTHHLHNFVAYVSRPVTSLLVAFSSIVRLTKPLLFHVFSQEMSSSKDSEARQSHVHSPEVKKRPSVVRVKVSVHKC